MAGSLEASGQRWGALEANHLLAFSLPSLGGWLLNIQCKRGFLFLICGAMAEEEASTNAVHPRRGLEANGDSGGWCGPWRQAAHLLFACPAQLATGHTA